MYLWIIQYSMYLWIIQYSMYLLFLNTVTKPTFFFPWLEIALDATIANLVFHVW